uniref:(northern house mosquito) hypothetical protein n=1 Tax=Culex pipiens TaxID=7175 RepID=A0A8D8BCA3_CULPI
MVAMKIILPFLCALALASGSRVELYKRRSVKEIEFAPDGRIVNGGEAQPGQFPYQALVLSYFDGDEEALCGGSLLSTNCSSLRDVIVYRRCLRHAWKSHSWSS